MNHMDFDRLCKKETEPQALEASVRYVADHIKPFLSLLEPVLICFPDEGPESLCCVFKRAVEMCGAIAIVWGPDCRWQELLRLAFDSHANTVIGPPQILLGLMKLSCETQTPLCVYDVIACGDPFPRWMVNGLKQGLDCRVWGCYAVHSSPVVAGFSCAQEAGIHIREDVFTPVVNCDPAATRGNLSGLYFRYNREPELTFDPEILALVQHQPCSCGCDSPRVQDTVSFRERAASVEALVETLLSWSSILDFRATNTQSGLQLELMVFPNEALPELPSCARLTVRSWDPEKDVPFVVEDYFRKKLEKSRRNY